MNNKRILVTGFMPFLTNKYNPTETLVNSLELPYIDKIVLPVSYKKVDEFFSSIKDKRYDFILSFGLAASRNKISIEEKAYNEKNMRTPDEDKFIPSSSLIDPLIDKELTTSIDVLKIQDLLKENEIESNISSDPGRYLCNYVYFSSLRKQSNKALFIHLPKEDEINSKEKMLKEALTILAYLYES